MEVVNLFIQLFVALSIMSGNCASMNTEDWNVAELTYAQAQCEESGFVGEIPVTYTRNADWTRNTDADPETELFTPELFVNVIHPALDSGKTVTLTFTETGDTFQYTYRITR